MCFRFYSFLRRSSATAVARLAGESGSGYFEVLIVLSVVIVFVFVPLRTVIFTFQGDMTIGDQLLDAYKSRSSAEVDITGMASNAFVSLKPAGAVNAELSNFADGFFKITGLTGFCAMALRGVPSGGVEVVAAKDEGGVDCYAPAVPPADIEEAFKAGLDPVGGAQFGVAVKNFSTPDTSSTGMFGLYSTKTEPCPSC